MPLFKKVECWICNRLSEASTWSAIGVIITGASALPYPFNVAVILAGALGVILKEKKHAMDSNGVKQSKLRVEDVKQSLESDDRGYDLPTVALHRMVAESYNHGEKPRVRVKAGTGKRTGAAAKTKGKK